MFPGPEIHGPLMGSFVSPEPGEAVRGVRTEYLIEKKPIQKMTEEEIAEDIKEAQQRHIAELVFEN